MKGGNRESNYDTIYYIIIINQFLKLQNFIMYINIINILMVFILGKLKIKYIYLAELELRPTF